VNRENALEMRSAMAAIGLTPADIFGLDGILWVEGETEAESFDLVLSQGGFGTRAVSIPVGHTGSFDKKVATKLRDGYLRDLFALYRKAGQARTLLPPYVSFVIDREERTPEQVQKIVDAGPKDRVCVLKWKMFENYLLSKAAVLAVLRRLLDTQLDDGNYDEAWLAHVGLSPELETLHGSNALRAVFELVSGGTVEYDKTRHGRLILDEILRTNQPFLEPLFTELKGAIERS
jgi:hypothetical protein